jgi:hypothetical protein
MNINISAECFAEVGGHSGAFRTSRFLVALKSKRDVLLVMSGQKADSVNHGDHGSSRISAPTKNIVS